MPLPYASYPARVVARVGLAVNAGALDIQGELGYDRDKKTGRLGDGTTTPPRFPTDKSAGEFDFTSSSKWTLPGGLVFDTAKPGQISGVTLADLNKTSGLLVRRGDGVFGTVVMNSTDETILIDNENGESNEMNFRLNADSEVLRALIAGYVDSGLALILNTLITIGPNPPANPRLGAYWFDTDDNTLYLRVADAHSQAWLDINS